MIGIVCVLCMSVFVKPQHSQVCQIGGMAIESMTSSSSAKGLICRRDRVNEYVGGGSKMKTRFGVSHSKTIHKWTCKDDMTMMMMLRSIVTYIHVWRSTTSFSSAYPRKNFVSIIYYNYSFDHQDKMLACLQNSQLAFYAFLHSQEVSKAKVAANHTRIDKEWHFDAATYINSLLQTFLNSSTYFLLSIKEKHCSSNHFL